MRIPLPSCYFAENDDSTHIVIDGVQRLTTINKFLNDEFALEGMTIFKDLEGKKFSELGDYKSDLETATIRCIVLRKDNPKALIREIFSRLNQGAVKLSDQEIRHAIYPGSLDLLLEQLSKIPDIAKFGLSEGSNKEKDSREPDEQILRYFAFSDDKELVGFSNSLREFLDNYMELNCNASDEKISELKNRFNRALSVCKKVFAEDVFVNPVGEKRRKGLVHYDLVMTTVGELPDDVLEKHAEAIRSAYKKLCESADFKRSLSGGLQDKSKVLKRKKKWNELLQEAICD